MKLQYSPDSKMDLDDIYEHIAEDSRQNAGNFIREIKKICRNTIKTLPYGGTERNDLMEGMRMFPFRRYLIFYRVFESRNTIEIFRIVEGSKKYERYFK